MSEVRPILIAASNARNLELLGEFLRRRGYASVSARTTMELDAAVESEVRFSLALVDVSGFGSSIWESCRGVRKKNIQLLVISPNQSAAIQKKSFALGAQSVLVKPLTMRELANLIRVLTEEA